jgi:hypothetical protein
VLKLPHHGAEGTVTNDFLEAVAPTHNFVPSHAGLWCSARSQRLRDWMSQRLVQNHVMALQGDVMVRHFSDQAPIWQSERPNQLGCHDLLAKSLQFPKDQADSSEFWFSLDHVVALEWAGVPAIRVRGWQIPHDSAARDFAMGVALMNLNDGTVKVFEAKANTRRDVVKHFAQLEIDATKIGFDQVIPVDGLPQGRYELALVRHEYPRWVAVKTGRRLTVAPDGVTFDVVR